MLIRGTADKKAAAAGGLAIVAGVALSVLGATAAPAHADVTGIDYTCVLSGVPIGGSIDLTLSITGAASGPTHVGDSVTLNGFQTTARIPNSVTKTLITAGATSVSGNYTLVVDKAIGDVGQQTVPVSMDIASVAPDPLNDLVLTAPGSPRQVSGFTADHAGDMTFTAGSLSGNLVIERPVLGSQTLPLTCSRSGDPSAAIFASTTVSEKPKPPSSSPTPKPSHSSPAEHTASVPAGLSNASPSESTTAAANTVSNNRTTAQHPQLARTGASHTVELIVGGGLLIVAGAGLMYAARRRAVPATR